jgi:hypothetical protein
MSRRQARSSAKLQGSSINSLNSARQEKSSSGEVEYGVASAALWEGHVSRASRIAEEETDGAEMVGRGFEVKDTMK